MPGTASITPAGIEISTDGPNGGTVAFGLVMHKARASKIGAIPFVDPESFNSKGYAYTGIASGRLFTPGRVKSQAALILANFTDQVAKVNVNTYGSKDGKVVQQTSLLVLPAQSSLERAIDGENETTRSLTVTSDLPKGGPISKLLSTTEDDSFRTEQLPKDLYDYRNGGTHPWSLLPGETSSLILFNHSDEARLVQYAVVIDDGRIIKEPSAARAARNGCH